MADFAATYKDGYVVVPVRISVELWRGTEKNPTTMGSTVAWLNECEDGSFDLHMKRLDHSG